MPPQTKSWGNKKLRAWQAAGLISLQPGRIIVLQPTMLKNFLDRT